MELSKLVSTKTLSILFFLVLEMEHLKPLSQYAQKENLFLLR